MIAADGRPTTVFAHLYNPDGSSWGWSLFAFDGGRRDALAQLQQACADVKAWGSVRTDGHIAFRGRADQPDMLRSDCRKLFPTV